jgi:hypothetical protein
MTYRGESWTKKIARAHFWSLALLTGPRSGKFVILASSEGGDIPCLRSFGVKDCDIVAVDMDEAAAQKFREKYPEIQLFVGDVAAVIEKNKIRPSYVFLDFCSQLCGPTADTIIRVSRKMAPGGVLGVTLLIGREPTGSSTTKISVGGVSWNRKKMGEPGYWPRLIESFRAGPDSEPAYLRALAVGSLLSEDLRSPTVAHKVVYRYEHWCGEKKLSRQRHCEADPKEALFNGIIKYNSSDEERRGSTMATISYKICPRDMCGCTIIDRGINPYILVPPYSERTFREAHSSWWIVDQKFAGIFNISPRKVAAWRAHVTMGTYQMEAANE